MQSPQILDAGPRGGAGLESMAALSQGSKKTISFFKGDDGGTPIGSHKVFDFDGEEQAVGMVQTWNQCNDMLLTSMDKPTSVLLMDTETGATKSELSLRRQRANWNLKVDSITPQQKFEQYRQTNEYQMFGLGDGGQTVFAMSHDARAGENVEQYVISADSSRKYKSYTFSAHAQTKGGYLVLGRTDGAVALYDYIMQSENASCVIDSHKVGAVTSVDVAADGTMIVWTTAEFVLFTCVNSGHWAKGTNEPKPVVLRLRMSEADEAKYGPDDGEELAPWGSSKFDATTHRDEHGLYEREIISYRGRLQVRWSVRDARSAWEALSEGEGAASLDGATTEMSARVNRHMTVGNDKDIVALEGEIVRALHI